MLGLFLGLGRLLANSLLLLPRHSLLVIETLSGLRLSSNYKRSILQLPVLYRSFSRQCTILLASILSSISHSALILKKVWVLPANLHGLE